jgi:hypothetical protein
MTKETVYGHDLNKHSSDEIIEKIGIDKLNEAELLHSVLEVKDAVDFSLEHNSKAKHESEMLNCSANSYATYKRLYLDRRKTIVFPPSKHNPSNLRFWADSNKIDLLFYSLIAEGLLIIRSEGFINSGRNVDKFTYAETLTPTSP